MSAIEQFWIMKKFLYLPYINWMQLVKVETNFRISKSFENLKAMEQN